MASDDDDTPRKKKNTTWGMILLGLLALGLVGTGITGFGGSISSVGSVGSQEISIDSYARLLQDTLGRRSEQVRRPVTLAEARALGDLEAVRSELERQAGLDHETARLGLSVGDARVAEAVRAQPGLMGLDGSFDAERYRLALRDQGMTVKEFEANLRAGAARTLLQTAILGGIAPPDALTDQLMAYIAESRDFRWVRIGQAELSEDIRTPTAAELTAYYQANTPDFTLPEMKRITYAWIAPDMLLETVEVDEAAVRAIYDERIDQYQRPERRLVERLVFPDEASAAEAKTRLDAGEVTFADLVQERGLTLEAIDLGEQTKAQLAEAGEAVFALEDPGVVGPLPSSLGPALFQMNGVLAAQNTTFDEVKGSLATDLRLSAARREIATLREQIDDTLAAGATVEELAEETPMQVGTIDFWDGLGEGIATYDAFRLAAIELDAEAFPETLELEDGGLFAMEFVEILEPRLQPQAEVEKKLLAGWQAQETEEKLIEQANILAAQIATGASLETGPYPVESAEAILRTALLDGTPPTFMEEIFTLEPGETKVVAGFGAVFLVQLDAVNSPDMDNERVALQRQLIEAQAAQGIADDIYAAFAAGLAEQAGVSWNENAINAVHSQLGSSGGQ